MDAVLGLRLSQNGIAAVHMTQTQPPELEAGAKMQVNSIHFLPGFIAAQRAGPALATMLKPIGDLLQNGEVRLVLLNKLSEETKDYVQGLKEALQLLGYSETQVVLKAGSCIGNCLASLATGFIPESELSLPKWKTRTVVRVNAFKSIMHNETNLETPFTVTESAKQQWASLPLHQHIYVADALWLAAHELRAKANQQAAQHRAQQKRLLQRQAKKAFQCDDQDWNPGSDLSRQGSEEEERAGNSDSSSREASPAPQQQQQQQAGARKLRAGAKRKHLYDQLETASDALEEAAAQRKSKAHARAAAGAVLQSLMHTTFDFKRKPAAAAAPAGAGTVTKRAAAAAGGAEVGSRFPGGNGAAQTGASAGVRAQVMVDEPVMGSPIVHTAALATARAAAAAPSAAPAAGAAAATTAAKQWWKKVATAAAAAAAAAGGGGGGGGSPAAAQPESRAAAASPSVQTAAQGVCAKLSAGTQGLTPAEATTAAVSAAVPSAALQQQVAALLQQHAMHPAAAILKPLPVLQLPVGMQTTPTGPQEHYQQHQQYRQQAVQQGQEPASAAGHHVQPNAQKHAAMAHLQQMRLELQQQTALANCQLAEDQPPSPTAGAAAAGSGDAASVTSGESAAKAKRARTSTPPQQQLQQQHDMFLEQIRQQLAPQKHTTQQQQQQQTPSPDVKPSSPQQQQQQVAAGTHSPSTTPSPQLQQQQRQPKGATGNCIDLTSCDDSDHETGVHHRRCSTTPPSDTQGKVTNMSCGTLKGGWVANSPATSPTLAPGNSVLNSAAAAAATAAVAAGRLGNSPGASPPSPMTGPQVTSAAAAATAAAAAGRRISNSPKASPPSPMTGLQVPAAAAAAAVNGVNAPLGPPNCRLALVRGPQGTPVLVALTGTFPDAAAAASAATAAAGQMRQVVRRVSNSPDGSPQLGPMHVLPAAATAPTAAAAAAAAMAQRRQLMRPFSTSPVSSPEDVPRTGLTALTTAAAAAAAIGGHEVGAIVRPFSNSPAGSPQLGPVPNSGAASAAPAAAAAAGTHNARLATAAAAVAAAMQHAGVDSEAAAQMLMRLLQGAGRKRGRDVM